ncbi:MAG: hypothetical protein ACRDH5_00795 [bacterium]
MKLLALGMLGAMAALWLLGVVEHRLRWWYFRCLQCRRSLRSHPCTFVEEEQERAELAREVAGGTRMCAACRSGRHAKCALTEPGDGSVCECTCEDGPPRGNADPDPGITMDRLVEDIARRVAERMRELDQELAGAGSTQGGSAPGGAGAGTTGAIADPPDGG